ncbi:inclusion body family protein [Pseudomonas sp. AA27]|uniref:AidA/PixA family protein n=1 Tax=Pseudomonas sp. AA27 TaxID=2908652 RepID=UPI001F18BC9B|nr:AidA/PixA family protein [Pseudomonas sp. AA27]MCF1488607.1 inclusion body family protein [Pseudomonas sp. AA27]
MSGTTQTIDVLITVDADYLLSKPQDVAGSIAMVTRRDAIDSQASNDRGERDGGAELWIDANPGDNIRWRATTLSRNFDRIALITRVVQGDPHQGGNYPGSMSTPISYNVPNIPVPYLDKSAAHGISKTDVTYTFWQAVAEAPGKLWYKVGFVLLDRNLNQIGPEYIWDPYITVR